MSQSRKNLFIKGNNLTSAVCLNGYLFNKKFIITPETFLIFYSRRFVTALLYFALQDNLVVNPRILLHPDLASIQAEISFRDHFNMDWVVMGPSDEMYRFNYHFGIYLTRTVLQSNIDDLQGTLQTEWRDVLGKQTIKCCHASIIQPTNTSQRE